jgi:hypothetical protein
MKKIVFISIIIFSFLEVFSQENVGTVSGGYSWANITDSNEKATGFRINGLYEYNPLNASFAHGVSIGYIKLTSVDGDLTSTVSSMPVYYAPKYMFGKSDKFKVFVKGALGMQFAWLKREGIVNITDNDMGFYLGGGAGFMFFPKENFFINAEYELAYATNSWYRDGWINSASGGIGFRF